MTPARLFAVLIAALVGVEVWALNTPERGDTLSELVWAMNANFGPIVALLFGVLAGHWFWQRKR